jgi:hypothetical protein
VSKALVKNDPFLDVFLEDMFGMPCFGPKNPSVSAVRADCICGCLRVLFFFHQLPLLTIKQTLIQDRRASTKALHSPPCTYCTSPSNSHYHGAFRLRALILILTPCRKASSVSHNSSWVSCYTRHSINCDCSSTYPSQLASILQFTPQPVSDHRSRQ